METQREDNPCAPQTAKHRIVLAALNARYIHTAFGMRYLLANMGSLREETALLEFEISGRPADIAEAILAHDPEVVGLGIYIWNVCQTQELAQILRKIAPSVQLVAGGPEITHAPESHPLFPAFDHIICGEADHAFANLCTKLLAGETPPKILVSEKVAPDSLASPYPFYSSEDIAHRILYVEASRGCPYTCEFCLSSLENGVRPFPLDPFLQEMRDLLDRGARHFKFIDRTFNLSIPCATAILDFFLENLRPGLFLHFEMVPDRLPQPLRERIARFPVGSLQFEIGIQTFNPEVADAIRRRQNYEKLEENLRFLRQETGAYLHADLIAGLPGESLASFAAGFDRLVALDPHEIQVGILKRLRGVPITRHDATWNMVYSAFPPYELLSNQLLDFPTMQKLGRFARFWDLVSNSGNFKRSKSLLWQKETSSPFFSFLAFSEWLHKCSGKRSGIALTTMLTFLFEYLTDSEALSPALCAEALLADYRATGHRDTPLCLRSFLPDDKKPAFRQRPKNALPKRQQKDQAPDSNEHS